MNKTSQFVLAAQNQPCLKFNTGNLIPQIGYGTYQLKGKECVDGVKTALEVGYRHIDSASIYRNGRDIRVPNREQVFITSKIAPQEQGYQETIDACKKILADLDTSYLDLLLIHWPGCAGLKPQDEKNAQTRVQTYRALEDLRAQGLVRDIGVSNFRRRHLEHLLKNCKVKPVVNQIEVHPLGWDKETVNYCKENGILIQAYSPLARNDEKLMKNPLMVQLSSQYKKTVAQIALRWGIQNGFIILPKSRTVKYIQENFNIFDFNLSEGEMAAIEKLNIEYYTCWNPDTVKF